MNVRPRSTTVISWFLIITGIISLVTTALTYDDPDVVKLMELSPLPIVIQQVLLAIGLLISIVCGALMLKALNIARVAYVVWTGLSLVIGLFTSPAIAMLIPNGVIFMIIVFFLFRPKANEYFTYTKERAFSDS